MGIKSLDSIIRNHAGRSITNSSLIQLRNSRVVVDISGLIYKYILGGKSNVDYIKKFKYFHNKFVKHNITPLYIFDGKAPKEKENIIKSRKEKIDKYKSELDTCYQDLNNLPNKLNNCNDFNNYIINKYFEDSEDKKTENYLVKSLVIDKINNSIKRNISKSRFMNKDKITDLKDFMKENKILFYQSDIEADYICSTIVKQGYANYCISDDTDMFLYGCPNVVRNINFYTEELDIYNLDTMLSNLSLDFIQFKDLCILLGCDYLPRTIGVSPNNILNIIKKYGSIENINNNIDYINENEVNKTIYMNDLDKYNNTREIFSDNYNFNLQQDLII